MAHNAPPPGETVESRIMGGLAVIGEGRDHLNLGNYSMELAIGDEGVQTLMSAIAATSSDRLGTTKITLYGNHIKAAGAATVADVLQDTPSLRSINLQTNAIGAEGAKCIASALESETCGVTKICLGWQPDIGDEGGMAIARALMRNRTVTTLNLPECGITDKSAVWFAEALRDNHLLTRLDLEGNRGLSPLIHQAIRDACLINQKRIKVPWNKSLHYRFPKTFKNQVAAIVILGESAFTALPHDLTVELFQTMYDINWHQGSKIKALEVVPAPPDLPSASLTPKKQLSATPLTSSTTRRSTRSASKQSQNMSA